MNKRKLFFLIKFHLMILWAVLFVAPVLAEVSTVTATHTYALGDRDSKDDARTLCFTVAKRKLLEKIGSFISSSTEVSNLQLTKDQIGSYSAALLSIEIVHEDFHSNNGNTTLTLTVKADIDRAEIRKQLERIVSNQFTRDSVKLQEEQIKALEERFHQLDKGQKEEHVTFKTSEKPNDAVLAYECQLRSERGEVLAQLCLGLLYAKGKGVPKNQAQALLFYERAANQGNAAAQFFLGSMYLKGTEVPRDYPKAHYWLNKAAEQDYAAAQHNLGVMYADGLGVEKDKKIALELTQRAANQGFPPAQISLGWHYFKVSEGRALEWFHRAAEQGDSQGQYDLGLVYGALNKHEQAISWTRKAADLGHPDAQYSLCSDYFWKGIAAEFDSKSSQEREYFRAALPWCVKAAEQGHAEAQFELGEMYRDGKGVPKDKVLAYKWFNLAAPRSVYAKKARDKIEKIMSAVEIAAAEQAAREWTETHVK